MQAKIGEIVTVIGTATKDAEFKLVGDKKTPMCTFSLAAGKRKDTTTIFVNCKAWRHIARYASEIVKGDTVKVEGAIEDREYNGKTYSTLVADWLNIIPQEGAVAPPSTSTFEELADDESELPF